MGRVSIQLKIALGLTILILIALLWKIPEPTQENPYGQIKLYTF